MQLGADLSWREPGRRRGEGFYGIGKSLGRSRRAPPASGGKAEVGPRQREVFTTAPSSKPRPRRLPRAPPVRTGGLTSGRSLGGSSRYFNKPSVLRYGVPSPDSSLRSAGGEFRDDRRKGRPAHDTKLHSGVSETPKVTKKRPPR